MQWPISVTQAISTREARLGNTCVAGASNPFRPLTIALPTEARDRAFLTLLSGCRATGGIATGGEIAGRLARRACGTRSEVVGCLARGELLTFEWHGNLWLPMFQFDCDMRLTSGPQAVIAELADVFSDPWELAHWFVQPHAVLGDRMPVELITDMEALLDAARVDRFIVLG